MVWPFLMGGSALLFVASALVGNGWALRSSLIILAGLIAVRAKKFVFMDENLSFVVGASIWVIAAVAIPRQVVYNERQSFRASSQISLFLIASGLCSLWARLTDAPRAFGSPPYVTADLLLIAAMLVIGWQIRDDILSGIRSLGLGDWMRGFGSVGRDTVSSDTMGGKEDWPQKVGRHG